MEGPSAFVLRGTPSFISQGPPTFEFKNFGAFETVDSPPITSIVLDHVTLDAALFCSKLEQLDTTHIESIRFQNVQYTNKFSRIYLPELKNFSFHSKNFENEDFETTSIFFFEKLKNQNWSRAEICNLDINIDVKLGNVNYFTLHNVKYPTLNNTNNVSKHMFLGMDVVSASSVLQRCEPPLERLAIHFWPESEEGSLTPKDKGSMTFDLALLPQTLKSLELFYEGLEWTPLEKAISALPNLEELFFKPLNFYAGKFEDVVITRLPPNLKKLSFLQCHVTVSDTLGQRKLDALCFNKTQFDDPNGHLAARSVVFLRTYQRTVATWLWKALDTFLKNSETIFLEMRISKENLEKSDSKVAQILLDAGMPLQDEQTGKSEMTNHDVVFFREPITVEQNILDPQGDWRVRKCGSEEKDAIVREYNGLPMRTRTQSWDQDFEHELLTDACVHFCVPPRRPRLGCTHAPLAPKFFAFAIGQPLLIKHLWLEGVRIYNEELVHLKHLPNLEHVTLKKCTCTSPDTTSVHFPVPGCARAPVRRDDGFALGMLPSSVHGFTAHETALGSQAYTSAAAHSLYFFMADNCSGAAGNQVNAKQVAVIGREKIVSSQLEVILKSPAVETVLVGNVDRTTSSDWLKNFLEASGLDTWETSFVLLRNSDGAWHGAYVNGASIGKYVEMAGKFKSLRDEFKFPAAEPPLDLILEREYLKTEISAVGVPVHFQLPLESQRKKIAALDEAQAYKNYDNEPQNAPLEKYDAENKSLEYEGYYDFKKRGDAYDHSRTDSFLSDFENFSILKNGAEVRILKLKSTVLATAPFLKTLKILNIQILSEIHLKNVDVREYFENIELPNLKNLNICLYENGFSNEIVKNFENFQKFLLFFTSPQNRNLENVLCLNTSISFCLGNRRKKYLEVDQVNRKLLLFKQTFLNRILKKEGNLKQLVLNSMCDVDFEKVEKSKLEVLSVQDDGFFDWEDMQGILDGMSSLTEFYFHRKPFGRKIQVDLDGIPSSVRYLVLSDIRLTSAPVKGPLTLDHLVLLDVGLSPHCLSHFHLYFNAKRLMIRSSSGRFSNRSKSLPGYALLKSLTRPESITEWIYVSDFDRGGADSQTQADGQLQADNIIQANSQLQADSSIQVNSQLQNDSQLQADNQTQADSQLPADSQTQADNIIQADREIEADSQIQADSKIEADSRIQADSSIQADSKIQAAHKFQADSKTEADSRIQADSEIQAVGAEMVELLRTAMDPEYAGRNSEWSQSTLNLEKRSGRWWHCSLEHGFLQQLSQSDEIFQNFEFGKTTNLELFKNKIIYFEGFGSEVTEVKSIDIKEAVIDTELFRTELKRVGTAGIESVVLNNVTWFGPPLQYGEIPIPNLQKFHITGSEWYLHDTKPPVWDDLKSFVWFRKGPERPSLKNLWALGVDMFVKPYAHDDFSCLEFRPERKMLTTRLDEGNAILKTAVNDLEILNFVSATQVPLAFPPFLKFLKLDCPLLWQDLESALFDHSNLAEIHFGKETNRNDALPVALISKLPKSLQVLKLSYVEVVLSTHCIRHKLKSLSFEHCSFSDRMSSEDFEAVFDAEEIHFKDVCTTGFPNATFVFNCVNGGNLRILSLEGHTTKGEMEKDHYFTRVEKLL